MQLYYIIEKHDTEQIRFHHTEVEKFSQSIARGYDSYSEAKEAMKKAYAKFYKGREVVRRIHGMDEALYLAKFCEPEFHEDNFGNRSKSTIEIFLVKPLSLF